ncbi:MAG: VOC family protein [Alphaproteobacteria bacterium]
MLSHVSFGVRDLKRAAKFYDAVLKPLGYARVWTSERGVGYGESGKGDKLNLFPRPDSAPPGPGFHLAFNSPNRESVDAFYAAALRAGATDNGPPGPRPHYSATYYAAFVIDPEGYKLEAVHQ